MKGSSTVGSIHVRDLLEALRRLGASPRRLLAGIGLDEEGLKDPDARVRSARLLALFQAAERRLGDPLVGLHAGEVVDSRGPLFYLLLSSPRFGEGLDLLARFARVPLDTQTIDVAVEGDGVSLTIDPGDPSIRRDHHAVDYLMSAFLAGIRRAVPGVRQAGVDLAHGPIGDPREAERVFGCPVRFHAAGNVLRFPASALSRSPGAANPAVARLIQRYTAALLEKVSSERVTDRAEDAIRLLLVDGARVERGLVARRLFMSERTLKRRLRQEGDTFKGIRDRVRADTALALLSDRALKVGAVARSVGFAETASFSKAFVRWSGFSPARYRAKVTTRGRPRAHSAGHWSPRQRRG